MHRGRRVAEVFLSYSRMDRPTAQAIADELQSLGVEVWWDHDLLGGEDYRVRIDEVLARAAIASVIWSRRSIESQWVIGEAAAARERKALIPLSIDGAQPPIDFRALHTIDFAGWAPGDRLPSAFLKAVGERLGRPLSYATAAPQAGSIGRLARKATQSWYLDFESLLFYLIGQGIACYLCTMPIAYFMQSPGAFGSTTAALPAWMPYAFTLLIGMIVAPLYMRPMLETRRLAVAAPLYALASLLAVVSYAINYALLTQIGTSIIVTVGPAALLLLLVTAIAARANKR
jgi:hypothetical protein